MRFLPILLLVAGVLQAGDDPVDPVFEHLRLKKGARLVDSPRSLMETYPYLEGVTPETLPRFVEEVRDLKQAADAARLFVAGTIVSDKEQADRIIATARELKKELKHLDVDVTEYRPKSYTPTAKDVDGGFEVSFVAFEMNGMLQLVHVVANVKRDGTVSLKRNAIVSGPMTSWQTAMLETEDQTPEKIAADMEAEAEARAEAVKARARYAKALKPARNLDTAWAIARLGLSLDQVEDLWGKPDRKTGSGLMIRLWKLDDGTAMVVGAGGPKARPSYIRHVESLQSMRKLHSLYAFPPRRR
jgi:hypothetical protein